MPARLLLVIALALGLPTAALAGERDGASAPAATPAPAKEPAPGPWSAPEPPGEQRPAYFAYLLQVMPATLEKTTCHCCSKSLARCYLDMPDPSVRAKCPFG